MNEREKRFVEEYVRDPTNVTEAAIRAGYSAKTAHVQGSRLLSKVREIVEPRLREEQAKLRKQTSITKERIVREVARLAFVDVGQMFDNHGNPIEIPDMKPHVRRAIQGFEFEENFVTHKKGDGEKERMAVGYTKKFKLADKLRANELLAKLLGYLKEDHANAGPVTIVVQNYTVQAPKEEPLTLEVKAS